MQKKLNIGSAGRKKEGYINVDWNDVVKPDVLHDLNKFPYPFRDGEFDVIDADHIIEHLDRPFDVMREIHRILKPGGILSLKVPHYSRGFAHPEHAHGFDITFPLYFNPIFKEAGYFGVDFELVDMKMNWMTSFHLLHHLGYKTPMRNILLFLNYCFSGLANAWPAFCARFWSGWVGGFDEVHFIMKASK